MKTTFAIGVVSEILLVAGIACIGFQFIATLGHFEVGTCTDPNPLFGCPVYAQEYYGAAVLFGFVLLVASAVGFLFTLKTALTTKGGTASRPPKRRDRRLG